MRIPTHSLLITATLAAALAAGQPAAAQSSAPLTADEKRENSRLSDAKRATRFRKRAAVMIAYAEECGAAFAAGEPMPEPDIRITEEVGVDDDLAKMTVEEISEQFGIASDATREARRAMNDCMRKYVKKRKGGS